CASIDRLRQADNKGAHDVLDKTDVWLDAAAQLLRSRNSKYGGYGGDQGPVTARFGLTAAR
ncbi:MAG: hypothetical protein WBN23_08775, partial [Woeseia sp.]